MQSLLSLCGALALAATVSTQAFAQTAMTGGTAGAYEPPAPMAGPAYQPTFSPGYPNGQPVAPAAKPYYSEMGVGSSMPTQTYRSSFGGTGAYDSSPPMAGPAYQPTFSPGYPYGQPVAPAAKGYYSYPR